MKVKIKFYGFWNGFQEENFYILNELRKIYDIEISEEPDYVIYTYYFLYKKIKMKYPNAILIYYTGENTPIDLNLADYSIGFDTRIDEKNYIRMPIYYILTPYVKSTKKVENKFIDILTDKEQLLNRKFCNFIVSNSRDKTHRKEMFNELSKYKRIDSGGKVFNNIGYLVDNKEKFIKDYKFSLCFENSFGDGYITEKIIEAFAAKTIPIYSGCKEINNYINENSYINVNNFNNFQEAIDYIIEIDRNDDLYLKMLKEPVFKQVSFEKENLKLLNFFIKIFENK